MVSLAQNQPRQQHQPLEVCLAVLVQPLLPLLVLTPRKLLQPQVVFLAPSLLVPQLLQAAVSSAVLRSKLLKVLDLLLLPPQLVPSSALLRQHQHLPTLPLLLLLQHQPQAVCLDKSQLVITIRPHLLRLRPYLEHQQLLPRLSQQQRARLQPQPHRRPTPLPQHKEVACLGRRLMKLRR